jgi:hypothetical protein
MQAQIHPFAKVINTTSFRQLLMIINRCIGQHQAMGISVTVTP